MGQVFVPAIKDIILTDVDRLVARNADGGIDPLASHIILFGEDAGQNLGDIDGAIAMGGFALDAGLTDTELHGTIAIGLNALSALTGGTNNDDATSGSVAIGENAGALATVMSGCVVIGCEALASILGDAAASGPERSVVIGNEAGQRIGGATQFTSNTLIGWRSGRGAVGSAPVLTSNVFVGDQIASSAVSSLTNNTVVGAAAGVGLASGGINTATANTIVGAGAGGSIDNGDNNTLIGSAASTTQGNDSQNVCVGANSTCYGDKHTMLGRGATMPNFGVVGARSIIIGFNAGITLAANLTDICALETFDGGVQNGCLYANMATGATILGRSQQGIDRDLGGAGATQLVKILNGTLGAAAPTGGLFLFSSGGELRMQASANVERIITGVFLVAGLPPAVGRGGSKAFVTDALAPAFGAAVAGGGAVFTPVYCDGVGWFVG